MLAHLNFKLFFALAVCSVIALAMPGKLLPRASLKCNVAWETEHVTGQGFRQSTYLQYLWV